LTLTMMKTSEKTRLRAEFDMKPETGAPLKSKIHHQSVARCA